MVPRRTEPETPKLRVRICRRRIESRALLVVASRPLPWPWHRQSLSRVADAATSPRWHRSAPSHFGLRGTAEVPGTCDVAVLSKLNNTYMSTVCDMTALERAVQPGQQCTVSSVTPYGRSVARRLSAPASRHWQAFWQCSPGPGCPWATAWALATPWPCGDGRRTADQMADRLFSLRHAHGYVSRICSGHWSSPLVSR